MTLPYFHIVLISLMVFPFQMGMAQERLKDTLRIEEVHIRGKLEPKGLSLQKIDSLELQQNIGGTLSRNFRASQKRSAQ